MIRLRLATTRDMHRCTVITTTSLIDDATYYYMWPKCKNYPEDNFTWWQLRLQKLLYDKRAVFLVVEIDGDSFDSNGNEFKDETVVFNDIKTPNKVPRRNQEQKPESTIISYGIWIRKGNDAAARQRMAAKNTWLNVLDASTTAIQEWSINQKYQRRDGDKARLDAIAAESENVRKKYFSDSPDWWSLELLVTARPYRSHGAASRIVRWGTEAGDREGVFCGVEASVMGAPLYRSLGFEKLTTWVVHVPGDTESLPYDVMRRDPKTGGEK